MTDHATTYSHAERQTALTDLLAAIDTAARRNAEYPGNIMAPNIEAIKRLADMARSAK